MCAYNSIADEIKRRLHDVPVENGEVKTIETVENGCVQKDTVLASSSGQNYKLEEKIDEVQKGYGSVRKVRSTLSPKQELAAKIYPLCNLVVNRKGDDFIQEIIIHYKAHKLASERLVEGIVPVCECILTSNDLILVMPFYNKKDLFYYVTQQNGLIPVSVVKSIFRRLTASVALLHDSGYIHRDISCENIYFHSFSEPSLEFKRMKREVNEFFDLGDFGMSSGVGDIASLCQSLGKPSYKSPQLHCKKLQSFEDWQANDVWALGIVLYVLLMKQFPFGTAKPEDGLFMDRVIRGNLEIRGREELSRSCYSAYELDRDERIAGLSLVKKMLAYKICDRATVAAIRDDPWLAEISEAVVGTQDECSVFQCASIASMHNDFLLSTGQPVKDVSTKDSNTALPS